MGGISPRNMPAIAQNEEAFNNRMSFDVASR